MMYSSWDMLRDRPTDGQTDRQKKWHIEVDAPPKNSNKEENQIMQRGTITDKDGERE